MKRKSNELRGLGFHLLPIKKVVEGKDRKKEHPIKGFTKTSHFVLDYPNKDKELILHPTKGYRLFSV